MIEFRLNLKKIEKIKRQKKSGGFTMIELLCVIVIIGTLGSSAFSSLVDFRREARLASIRANLAALRISMKNKLLQVMLRCTGPGRISPQTVLNDPRQLAFMFIENNVVSSAASSLRCNASEFPNTNDRKFIDSVPVNPYNNATGISVDYTVLASGQVFSGPSCNSAIFNTLALGSGGPNAPYGWVIIGGAGVIDIQTATSNEQACSL